MYHDGDCMADRQSVSFDTGRRPDELDPERPEPFDTPWGSFALYLVEGGPIAVQSFCPHLLGPLFQGTVFAGEVTCPWHGWRFDLATGLCTHRPEGGVGGVAPLARLQVELGPRGTLVLRPV
jgi:nitrite reductase/ring-hydroxylating ferredoxin subunit